MPHTLLLADDSVTIQRVIELTFADEDIRVVAVSDGDQAIAVLDEAPPDIVLADVGMPGRSGYDVAKHIKETPRLAHIPVVLLTGAFEPIDRARAAVVGCDGVLAKPFEPQLVITRVKELLGGTKPRPEEPWSPSAEPSPADDSDRPPATSAIDDYFSRLDQALAHFSEATQPRGRGGVAVTPPPGDPIAADVAGDQPSQAEAFVPVPPDAAAQAPPQHTGSPQALPSLVEAFTALLEAEQAAPRSSTAPAWPAGVGLRLADDLVDQVARKLMEHLPERVIREAVADAVADIAERLIREEIDRIKASIK